PGGEARSHAHPLAGHRDLPEHEAVAAVDEASDALGHRAQGDQARHADRDAEHREEIAAGGGVPPGGAEETRRAPSPSSLDSTARPARRPLQRCRRTRTKNTARDSRMRSGIPRNPPPASTPVTESSMASVSRGRRNVSRKARS